MAHDYEPFKLYPIGIQTPQGVSFFLEYSPAGCFPMTFWTDLLDEYKRVYHQREDSRFQTWDQWIGSLEGETISLENWILLGLDKDYQARAVGLSTCQHTFHYGTILSYYGIMNTVVPPKYLYKALEKVARIVGVRVWCRGTWKTPMKYELKFKEI